MPSVHIRDRRIGPGEPVFIIAEIGINHNGSLARAIELIDAAVAAGCDAVKFQKRTIDVVYSPAELVTPRESPFGVTNGDLKRGLEFGTDAYARIDAHCRARGIMWFASCWDEASVDFVEQFDPPCYKIASACLTDHALLRHHARLRKPLLISTGMSTMDEIAAALAAVADVPRILLHCTSTYPCNVQELNLRAMRTLAEQFAVPVGYSGHEVGLATTVAAAALGACVVERHITLDRAMWGSDQAASLEVPGLHRLVKDVRAVELALGDGIKRVYASEEPVRAKLRRVGR